MINPQYQELANLLINHSCTLKKGEKLLIEAFDVPEEMVIATIRAARKAGGSDRFCRKVQDGKYGCLHRFTGKFEHI